MDQNKLFGQRPGTERSTGNAETPASKTSDHWDGIQHAFLFDGK